MSHNMKVAADAPKRPALRYYGGKWNLAEWIISHFPEHSSYVEPCGGAASVLLQKPRSALETYNDLDGNVVNFFQVLRDQPDELIHKLSLTPWARAEYELSLQPCSDPVEKARRYFVAVWMSIGQSITCTPAQFRSCTQSDYIPMRLQTDSLRKITDRFMNVQIENKPFDYVINRYDTPDTLIYFDPPYVTSTRSMDKVYLHEWTNADHIAAADIMHAAAGYVVVSGYRCALYDELYAGWQRVDKEAKTNGGQRTESLWLSPRTSEALAQPKQWGLYVT